MVTKAQILDAMQFSNFVPFPPINTTGSPRQVITYQFAGNSEPVDWETTYWGTYNNWTALSAAEKAAFRTALAHIETFLNVTFQEVTGDPDPDMNVGKVTLPAGVAGFGGSLVWNNGSVITQIDSYVLYDRNLDLSSGRTNLILHELGHAGGLKHPFDAPALPTNLDSNKYTVMSYTANPDNGVRSDAMMLYDIFALQDIWGAADYNTGNDTYTGSRTSTVDAIWDTGGVDSFSAGTRTTPVTFDLRQGKFSTFDATDDVAITFGTRIENATGGKGGDKIIGNGLKNELSGMGGADTIKGGGNVDVIRGGKGNDNVNGQAGNDKLFGDGGRDVIHGGKGKDIINGGKGNDKMFGDAGADTFVFAARGGKDVIRDFTDNVDTVKLKGFGFATVADALATATDVGSDAIFTLPDGSQLKILGITVAQLADDLAIA